MSSQCEKQCRKLFQFDVDGYVRCKVQCNRWVKDNKAGDYALGVVHSGDVGFYIAPGLVLIPDEEKPETQKTEL